jgi:hypothetical protein
VISQEANQLLSRIAIEARPKWPEYSAYCGARESGLRQTAFAHLSEFITSINGRSAPERREFTHWLCLRVVEHGTASAALLPDPLLQRVLLPVISEWKLKTPRDGAPFRWLGILLSQPGYQGMRAGLSVPTPEVREALETAVEIDPQDQIALVRLIECMTGLLDYNAHHLPEGYLGDPVSDLHVAESAISKCERVHDESERDRLRRELEIARQLIADWSDCRRSGQNFREWCRDHGREYQGTITRVYVRPPEGSAEADAIE